MTPFKLVWDIHKWIGLILGCVLIASAITGLLLLLKKDYPWLQPPTQAGTVAAPAEYRPLGEVFDTVFAAGIPQLQSMADVERVDFRPSKGVHKIHSHHDNVEVQVDAVSLQLWGPEVRRSDWIEQLHDGSLLGDAVHGWFMPLFAVALVVLAVTGYLVWLWPKLVKRRKRRAARAS